MNYKSHLESCSSKFIIENLHYDEIENEPFSTKKSDFNEDEDISNIFLFNLNFKEYEVGDYDYGSLDQMNQDEKFAKELDEKFNMNLENKVSETDEQIARKIQIELDEKTATE